jgi:hypothetical protein
VPSEASAGEDRRVWVGRVAPGHETEHTRFVAWLNGPEAQSIFLRRRLTEYQLWERGDTVTVAFKAPHTGDPRLIIDFLRYPGMWPEYWQFERGGRVEDVPTRTTPDSALKVNWQRA